MIDLEQPDFSLARDADLVICADVIEHLENPDRLMAFIAASMGERGHTILSTPDRLAMHGEENTRPANPAHIREWSRKELRRYVESKGFTVLKQFNVMTVPIRSGRMFFDECLRPLLQGRSLFCNQVVLLEQAR